LECKRDPAGRVEPKVRFYVDIVARVKCHSIASSRAVAYALDAGGGSVKAFARIIAIVLVGLEVAIVV
jgi:hypothetical protein